MGNAKTETQKKNKTTAPKSNKKRFFLILLSVIFLGIFSPCTLLLLGIGMIPALIASALDRSSNKTGLQTVGCFNLCGVVTFVLDLWQNGNKMDYLQSILHNQQDWAIMYGSAGIGLLVYQMLPIFIAALMDMRGVQNIANLNKKLEDIRKEWGDEVAEPQNKSRFMPLAG